MGIPIKPSRYLTAKDAIAIKKDGHAQFDAAAEDSSVDMGSGATDVRLD